MRFPNKVTPYKDSTIAKVPVVLKYLKSKDYTVLSLFDAVRNKMSIKEYIDTLDCLFVLEKIVLKEEIIHYVDRNILWQV